MKTSMLAFACFVLLGAASVSVKEPATGTSYPDTIEIGTVKAACTGVDVRTKFFFNIYAVAHYGDVAAWPKQDKPEDRLKTWTEAKAAKAFVLTFTYDVSSDKIKGAWEEGLDNAGYTDKEKRESFLGVFKTDLKKTDILQFTAQADGTLSAELNKKSLGTWKDEKLVHAIWAIWMSDKSVVKDRTRLVARQNP